MTQRQLLEVQLKNSSLEELKARNEIEINTLRERVAKLESQLSRAQTVNKLNPLVLARNIGNKIDMFGHKRVEEVVIDKAIGSLVENNDKLTELQKNIENVLKETRLSL